MSDSRSSDILVAFGIGALVGIAGALLLAPASGEETRRRLGAIADDMNKKTREGADKASEYVKDQAGKAGEYVKDQKERITHAIEEGTQAYKREVARS